MCCNNCCVQHFSICVFNGRFVCVVFYYVTMCVVGNVLCHYIHSGSEGSLVCQTSQHVGPVRSIDVNPFQVPSFVLC